ncbi:apoptotic chromatin condensation inducer in the nucleus isoform X3 [Oncorhynchus keta]|uniref:apoptotic chromatin condensation inducer in the nucleus isoform X3 n=1 Tax=Oncorhynchus keta TaxID=8018 RepID=UPI00227A8808|nr:apoptotic chromatin condensation inducer in the nucleus isoform X3 [Oncorhynchus keta]
MADLEDVKLDGRPLQSLRVADLKAALEERGLPKSGQKNTLVKRLKGALMLENLQRTSHHHIGLQPNSQIGEEMSQNSFIKQYLSKQQELLRQRLEREAREAVEDDDTDKEDHTQDNHSAACAAPDQDVAPVLVDQHKLFGLSEGKGLAGPAREGEGHMSRDGHVSPPPAPTSAVVSSLAVRVAVDEQRPERVPADSDDDGADEDWDSGARRRNLGEPPRGQLARARSGGSRQHPQHIPPLLSPQLRQPTPPPSPPPELSFPLPDTPKQSPPSPGEPPARQRTSSTSSSGSSSSGSCSSSPDPQSNTERKPGPLTLLARKMASEGAFSGVGWHGRGDAERQDNNAATATMSSGRGPQEGTVSAITHTTNAAASLPFPRLVPVTNQGALGGHLLHSEVPVSVLRPTIMEERDAAWPQENNKEKELQAESEREKSPEQERLGAVEQERLERQRIFEQQHAVEQERERALERERKEIEKALARERKERGKALAREKAFEQERKERALAQERAQGLEREEEEREKALAKEREEREKAMQLETQRAMERERALEQEKEKALESERKEKALEREGEETALEREREETALERERVETALERERVEKALEREREVEKALEREREVEKALEREREVEKALEREREVEKALEREREKALELERMERVKVLELERQKALEREMKEKERGEKVRALEQERIEREKALEKEREERERALEQEKVLQREKEKALEQEKALQREKEERERALEQEKALQREKEERERALEQEKALQREKEERERALEQEALHREKEEKERALEQEKALHREKEEKERALEQEKALHREKEEKERVLEQEKALHREKEEKERALEQEKALHREKEEKERALEQEKALHREKEEKERALKQEKALHREKEERESALEQEKALHREKEERESALEQEKALQREERERALEQEKALHREKEEKERALEQEKALHREKEEKERALEQEKALHREKEEKERVLEQEKALHREKEEKERALEQEKALHREKEKESALEQEKALHREKEKERALEQEKALHREKEEKERVLEQEKALHREKEEKERALEQEKALHREKEERESHLPPWKRRCEFGLTPLPTPPLSTGAGKMAATEEGGEPKVPSLPQKALRDNRPAESGTPLSQSLATSLSPQSSFKKFRFLRDPIVLSQSSASGVIKRPRTFSESPHPQSLALQSPSKPGEAEQEGTQQGAQPSAWQAAPKKPASQGVPVSGADPLGTTGPERETPVIVTLGKSPEEEKGKSLVSEEHVQAHREETDKQAVGEMAREANTPSGPAGAVLPPSPQPVEGKLEKGRERSQKKEEKLGRLASSSNDSSDSDSGSSSLGSSGSSSSQGKTHTTPSGRRPEKPQTNTISQDTETVSQPEDPTEAPKAPQHKKRVSGEEEEDINIDGARHRKKPFLGIHAGEDNGQKDSKGEEVKTDTTREVNEAAMAEPKKAPESSEECVTPKAFTARRISLNSSKASPGAVTAEGETESGAGRKRRWGSSTAVTTKKSSMSITTDSLKFLIPDIRLCPGQEMVVDLHPEEDHLSGVEGRERGEQDLKIRRTVTQVVLSVTQENGQKESKRSEHEEEDREDGREVKEDREEKMDGSFQRDSMETQCTSPPSHDMEMKTVTPSDTMIRRSITIDDPVRMAKQPSPPRGKVSITIDDPVRMAKQPSPPRGKVSITIDDPVRMAKQPSPPRGKVSITIDDPVRMAKQPSPPRGKVSNIVHVSNLVRPFTLSQLKELLGRTGTVHEDCFWIDKIKSHCYVTYSSAEESIATRAALHGVKWPQSNPKFLSLDFIQQEELDFHRGLPPPERAGEGERGAAAVPGRGAALPPLLPEREQWAEREREMEHRERTRAEREWDRDKVRDIGPGKPGEEAVPRRSRSRERKRKERKMDKKEKAADEPPVKLLDELFKKTKAAPCIYWLPLTEEQFSQKETAHQERMKEREKRRKEQQEEVEKKREEDRRERMKAASAASGERGEGELYRERERDWGRDGESDKHREYCYRRPGCSSAGGARCSRSRSDTPPRDRRR